MGVPLLVIDVESQSARLEAEGRVFGTYPVSTAAAGTGNSAGSLRTPTGLLRIAEKIGEGAPVGAVFRSRVATGEVWSFAPENPLSQNEADLVLTRILWLAGAEADNANTLERFIYLHGTNHETDLGRPASHGCIRFANADIVEVFNLLSVGALVEIR